MLRQFFGSDLLGYPRSPSGCWRDIKHSVVPSRLTEDVLILGKTSVCVSGDCLKWTLWLRPLQRFRLLIIIVQLYEFLDRHVERLVLGHGLHRLLNIRRRLGGRRRVLLTPVFQYKLNKSDSIHGTWYDFGRTGWRGPWYYEQNTSHTTTIEKRSVPLGGYLQFIERVVSVCEGPPHLTLTSDGGFSTRLGGVIERKIIGRDTLGQ